MRVGLLTTQLLGALLLVGCQPRGAEPPVEFPKQVSPPPTAATKASQPVTPEPVPVATVQPGPDVAPKVAADVARPAAPKPSQGPITPGPKRLRRVFSRLLDRPEAATPTPPLDGKPNVECIRAPDPSGPNPYSTLPEAVRPHHARVTIAGGGIGRVELRDALVFGGPRTFHFKDVVAPRMGRFEMGYRVYGCGVTPRTARMLVTVQAGVRPPQQVRERLLKPAGKQGSRFVDWSLDLGEMGVPRGKKFDLTVTFEGDELDPVNRFVWTEPRITGVAEGAATLLDRSVLLIIVDAMRADTVGPSRKFPTSIAPHMEAWMNAGVSFKQAISASNQTRPSTLGLLQGQAPTMGQFHATSWRLSKARKERFYESEPPLVTRALRAAGHRVAAIGHNRFLWESIPIGLDHGFDRIIDVRAMTDDTPLITDHAITYMRRHQDQRFFLQVNYVAPHNPYKPPPEFIERVGDLVDRKDRRRLSRSYLGEIAYVDDQIGKLRAAVQDMGLDASTVVVITADHGENFHPRHTCYSERFKMPCLNNHGLTLYDEELHVPFSLTLAGQLVAATPPEVVSHLSFAPTLLELLGLPTDPRHSAGSLLPGLLGQGPVGTGVAYAETRAASAVRTATHKFIAHHPRNDVVTPARKGDASKPPPEEVYDLRKDPKELNNLALDPAATTIVDELRAKLEWTRKALRQRLAAAPVPRDTKAADGPTSTAPKRPVWARDEIRVAGGPRGVSFYLRIKPARCLTERSTTRTRPTSTCRDVAGGVEIVGDVAADRVGGLKFDAQAQSKLIVELRLDAVAVPTTAIRLGPFGVAAGPQSADAAGASTLTMAQLAQATGAHPPHFAPLDEPQLFYWRLDREAVAQGGDSPESAGVGNDDDDRAMSKEMRQVLKGMGYTK